MIFNRISALLLSLAMAFIAAACLPASNARAQAPAGSPPLVILVRHAEKAPGPPDAPGPGLTAAGIRRAHVLAAALRNAGVTAIITSRYRRTQETAQTLAAESRVTPEMVPIDPAANMDAHIAAVVAAARQHSGETVVVVGHSNTIPLIIAALGGPTPGKICDSSYGHLFVVTSVAGKLRLVQSRYGAPDPAPGRDCQ